MHPKLCKQILDKVRFICFKIPIVGTVYMQLPYLPTSIRNIIDEVNLTTQQANSNIWLDRHQHIRQLSFIFPLLLKINNNFLCKRAGP